MAENNYPRTRRLLPVLALAVTLAGCSATDDYYATGRAQAESNRTVASAQLASTLALSQTVGTLTAQNAQLVSTVTAQAGAWQIMAVILATGLVVSVVLAVLIVARRHVPQAPIYVLPNSPTNGAPLLLDDPQEWPEVKARRRAARLVAPQDRYRLTAGR